MLADILEKKPLEPGLRLVPNGRTQTRFDWNRLEAIDRDGDDG